MVDGVREEDSSSQNVNLRITRKRRGADGISCRIFLSDGSSFLLFEEDASRFSADDPLDEDNLVELTLLQGCIEAYRKGLELCARREHSVLQIKQKLLKRSFSKEAVETALLRLKELRALDDSRYADVWVRSQIRQARKSRVQLEVKLREAGIASDIIRRVLSEYHDQDYELSVLEKTAGKLLSRYKGNSLKCAASLMRKGFSYRLVTKYLETLNDD